MAGTIITFYSYKGGTGRSMALANTALILAANDYRVLAIEWDFEAPGLHRYFLPFLDDPELSETPGLIDLLWDYSDAALTPKKSRIPGLEDPLVLADAQRYAVALESPFESKGHLHFLGAGQQEEAYADRVRHFNWDSFYRLQGGANFLEKLRTRLREQYDYVLIDSRTGVADTAGVCTIQMPDVVTLCLTYNRQSIKGVEAVAQSILTQREGKVRLLPIPMRVEKDIEGIEDARRYAQRTLDGLLPEKWNGAKRTEYWEACEVPHYPFHAFQEVLAVIRDLPGVRNSLSKDMLWLAKQLLGKRNTLTVPPLDASVRERILSIFDYRNSGFSEETEGGRPIQPEIATLEEKKEALQKVLNEHEQWLTSEGRKGKRANLSGEDHGFVDLKRVNLAQANLKNTNLQGANLNHANLERADLGGANLGQAKLREAKLSEAKLYRANLSEADLQGIDLRDADLTAISINLSDLTYISKELLEHYGESFHIKSLPAAASIIRSIEFPPEYKQAGMGILNYFGEVLDNKYPDKKTSLMIKQEGLKVTMAIETEEGDQEEIEQFLDQYGLVVRGEMEPKEFFAEDQLRAIELKSQLALAKLQIEQKQEMLDMQRLQLKEARLDIRNITATIQEALSKRGSLLSQSLQTVQTTSNQQNTVRSPNPSFEKFKGSNGEFYFILKAKNGEIILASEGYTSKAGCDNGIASVKANAPERGQYQEKRSKDGQYYFLLKAKNYEVIGKSEMYSTAAACQHGIQVVMEIAPGASVVDQS